MRLKRPEEMTPGEWIAYDRSGGRIPRVGDEVPDPPDEEMVAGGWRAAPPQGSMRLRREPMKGPVLDERGRVPQGDIEELVDSSSAAKRRAIRVLETEMVYVREGGQTHGAAPPSVYLGQLQRKIARLQTELDLPPDPPAAA